MITMASFGYPRMTLLNVIAHMNGTVWILWSVMDGWLWKALVHLFVYFSLCPMLFELYALLNQGCASGRRSIRRLVQLCRSYRSRNS